jgi:hypothetical protein
MRLPEGYSLSGDVRLLLFSGFLIDGDQLPAESILNLIIPENIK